MKPILQALLVADHVYIDAATNKKIVAGIFHRMTLAGNPDDDIKQDEVGTRKIHISQGGLRSGSPFCYLSLTEVRGSQEFTLRFVNLDDDQALFQTTFKADCNNPLETIEAVFPLPALPLKNEPGHYALELLWGQEPLGCHRITVSKPSATED